MTRATWADFVRWVAQIEWETSDVNSECWEAKRLRAAAHAVTSRGEAVAAVIGAVDYDPDGVEYLIGRWLEILRSQGVSPPAEQPSAVEELERIAAVMESSLGQRKSSNLSEWQHGFEASDRSTIEGLRERARQLKEQA